MQKEKSNARESILLATCTLLVRQGSEKLTLDSVAQEAGVSKGGLLYHFPSKQALLEGVLSWLLDSFAAEIHAYVEADPNPVGRWNRAHINAGIKIGEEEKMRVIASLLSIISTNPNLQSILEKHVKSWCEHLYSDGIAPEKVTIMQLAVDGYFFRKMFGPKDKDKSFMPVEIQEMMDTNYIKNLLLKLGEGDTL
jgi:AcrR family transcriptional regulator